MVAPLCAWHHAAFDREPDITGWAGLPPASQVISDFYLCKFPGLSQTDDSVAAALDARNDDGAIARAAAGASLTAARDLLALRAAAGISS